MYASGTSPTNPEGEVPAGTSPIFYGFKGPTATNITTEERDDEVGSVGMGYFRAPYPNPARVEARLQYVAANSPGTQQVRGVEADVSIYDVLRRRLSPAGNASGHGSVGRRISNRDEIAVSLDGLAPGLYFVRVGLRRGTRARTDTFSIAVVR